MASEQEFDADQLARQITGNFKPVELTAEQKTIVDTARVAFMSACPFYAHYFYAEMREVATLDITTACTDGRTVFYNPEYLATLKTPERVFVLAHEVDHVVCRDPQRMKRYQKEGNIRGVPFGAQAFNVVADYVRNALLIETGVGMCNPSWCYADDVTGEDLLEDVYERKVKPNKNGGASAGQPKTYGSSGKSARGAKGDSQADANGGSFDFVLPPPVDPVTGKEDVPDDATFKQAIAKAAAVAKAMGNMPAKLQKMVDALLQPQVDWREHVRMILTGKIGARHETWDRPNRRRLVLNPMVIIPGKRGYGAELVVVCLDTSGSIYASPKALEAFFSEIGGILTDVRPRRVMLIECDAAIGRVSEANTLDELDYTRKQGVTGGGGTSFVPPFEYLAQENLRPDSLIYLTDLMGTFPAKPSYPVVWCTIQDGAVPFGDKVVIKG